MLILTLKTTKKQELTFWMQHFHCSFHLMKAMVWYTTFLKAGYILPNFAQTLVLNFVLSDAAVPLLFWPEEGHGLGILLRDVNSQDKTDKYG